MIEVMLCEFSILNASCTYHIADELYALLVGVHRKWKGALFGGEHPNFI